MTTETISDPVILEFEKFMFECQNMTKPLSSNKTSKTLDTESLLNILEKDEDTNQKTRKNSKTVQKHAPARQTMPLKKRKIPEKPQIQSKKLKKNDKKDEKSSKKKPPKLSIKRAKFMQCQEIVLQRVSRHLHYPKKKKANILIANKTATVTVANIRNDTQIISTKVKINAFYPTSNEDVMFVKLRFAKINQIETIYSEDYGTIQETVKKALVKVIPQYLHRAKMYKPDVHCELNQSVIDLTECDSDEELLVIVSEKECANLILNAIHEFSKVYQVHRRIEEEVSEILDGEDCCWFQQGKILGQDLIHELRNKRMKNLDMTRFLNIVVFKLEQIYKIFVSSTVVALYLYIMLNQNKKQVNNQLLQDLLQETLKILEKTKVKLEKEKIPNEDTANGCDVFTEEQLAQLGVQIQQYLEICKRQEYLMNFHIENFQNLSEMKSYDEKKHDLLDILRFDNCVQKETNNGSLNRTLLPIHLIKTESEDL